MSINLFCIDGLEHKTFLLVRISNTQVLDTQRRYHVVLGRLVEWESNRGPWRRGLDQHRRALEFVPYLCVNPF